MNTSFDLPPLKILMVDDHLLILKGFSEILKSITPGSTVKFFTAVEKIKDDGCCKNTQVTVKVKDSHQTEAQVQMPKLFSIQLFLHPPVLEFLTNITPKFFSKISNKAPPLSTRVALHVFNCIFRN